ncbi:MAG: RsmB/NOP family class I SAM-dependent RNA methyltransferase [Burkholderiales bacterium]|nr:RsmB/NOP family class I SAM-dependent RNA methyltransferase [Burkholderiales bacterium]
MTVRASEIAALAAAIGEVRRFATPADSGLAVFFRAHREFGARDRAFIADGAFAYLRRKRSLEALAGTDDPQRLALAVVLREMGRSLRDLAPALNAADDLWARAFKSRLHNALPPAVAHDVPDWLWDRLGTAYGDDTRAALTRAWQDPAPFDLRVNVMKTTREAALAALVADGLAATATPFSPLGIRVTGRPSLARHPWLADGRLEVQDEGSQLVGYAVAPRRSDMVVDFCAGAGGKTLLLGSLMRGQGRLYAFDVAAERLAKLTPRLARSGLSNVHPQVLAHERDVKVKRLAGKIDRVLVDAPCTGFGTLRRNPDLKWRQPESAVAELAAKQAAILAAAATLVKPGGRLVYATCSVLPDENEDVVADFLAAHPSFALGDVAADLVRANIALDTGRTLKVLPHLHGCDGFFAAVLERRT